MCSDLEVAVLRRPQGGGVALVSASSCTIWCSSAGLLLGWCSGDWPISGYPPVAVGWCPQDVRYIVAPGSCCAMWCSGCVCCRGDVSGIR
ncbi:hypothetical protein BTHE_1955 [Bifidobacterium thermophilum]|nr:hypothetical protein BTHE_1955 [Bifidobacterium thermophilum]